MSTGLKGDVSSLKKYAAALLELPRVLAIKAAAAAAPKLTELAKGTFEAGEDPYGNSWEPGNDGQRITLNKTGGIFRGVAYVATGRKLRLKLTVPWAKYQVGKRRIAPTQSEGLPTAYRDALKAATAEAAREHLGAAR